MKQLLIVFAFLIANSVFGQKIDVIKKTPKWCSSCSKLSKGTWRDIVVVNPGKDAPVIAYCVDGMEDAASSPNKGKAGIFVVINGVNSFLELKAHNHKERGDGKTVVYSNKNKKIVLTYSVMASNASGNGDGGKLQLYVDEKVVYTTDFFWSY